MGEWLQVIMIFMMMVLILLAGISIRQIPNRDKKTSKSEYKVVIHFETSKIKLTLNPEQYEQLNAILNLKEGMFQIGDELDQITIYREAICWVKVKQK